MKRIGSILALGLALFDNAGVVRAEPIAPREIRVLDGDTIHAHGHTYRLVDFDAPETVPWPVVAAGVDDNRTRFR